VHGFAGMGADVSDVCVLTSCDIFIMPAITVLLSVTCGTMIFLCVAFMCASPLAQQGIFGALQIVDSPATSLRGGGEGAAVYIGDLREWVYWVRMVSEVSKPFQTMAGQLGLVY
jgi:hypothetical protein